MRAAPRLAVLMMLLALAAPAAAEPPAVDPNEPPEAPESAPREKRYWRRHLWHLVTAFGTNLAGNEYQGRVGTSTDPLIFSDPPGFDSSVRNWLRRDDPEKNYYLHNRSVIGLALTTGAIVLGHLGEERWRRGMADDATGLIELWYFDKGATELAKNIFGRQRPESEFGFVDPNSVGDDNLRHSFWSGATSRQFALMSYADRIVAARVHSRTARAFSFAGFYGLAAYVGYSRIAEDEHYFSDVVAGAAAGVLTARGFYRAHHPGKRSTGEPEEARLRLVSLAPTPGGVSVMFSIRIPN